MRSSPNCEGFITDSDLNQAIKMKTLELKVVLLGGKGSGKTSVMQRLVSNSFEKTTKPTLGVDIAIYKTTQKEYSDLPEHVNIQLMDVSHSLVEGSDTYLRYVFHKVDGVIMVFNGTNADRHSLQAMDLWRDTMLQYVQDVPVALFSNQSDAGKGVLEAGDLNFYVEKCHYSMWRATSAKTGKSVPLAMKSFLANILQHKLKILHQVAREKVSEKQHHQFKIVNKLNTPPRCAQSPSQVGVPSKMNFRVHGDVMDAMRTFQKFYGELQAYLDSGDPSLATLEEGEGQALLDQTHQELQSLTDLAGRIKAVLTNADAVHSLAAEFENYLQAWRKLLAVLGYQLPFLGKLTNSPLYFDALSIAPVTKGAYDTVQMALDELLSQIPTLQT